MTYYPNEHFVGDGVRRLPPADKPPMVFLARGGKFLRRPRLIVERNGKRKIYAISMAVAAELIAVGLYCPQDNPLVRLTTEANTPPESVKEVGR